MKRLSGAAAVAMFAVATSAHAQSGPVNHSGSSSMEAPRPVMAAGAMAPEASLESSVSSTRARVEADLAQHKISRSKAARHQRKLKAIHDQIDKLNHRVAAIHDAVPEPDAAPPT